MTSLSRAILISITIALVAVPAVALASIASEIQVIQEFANTGVGLPLGKTVVPLIFGGGFSGLAGVIAGVINAIWLLISIIAIGGVVFGGQKYILAFGDETKVKQAKSVIINSLFGFAVAMLSLVILRFVATIIGAPTIFPTLGPTAARDSVRDIIGGMLTLMSILAFGAIVYGGYLYITAVGNEEKAKRGKTTLIYALIGMVIVAISGALVNAIYAITT